MDRDRVLSLLERLVSGEKSVEAVAEALAGLATHDLEFARLDMHRSLRRGMPEAVYGEGKSLSHLVDIVAALVRAERTVLVTRVAEESGRELAKLHPDGRFDPVSRTFVRLPSGEGLFEGDPARQEGLLIVSAGTSDMPVAEEAAVTARCLDMRPDLLYDVGVAGIGRLLEQQESLRAARVVVVVAGMEGALASVVAGLVASPVVGVPTSVGYGASLSGMTALFGMLASCAGGLTVVNVDNGFGAACAARAILSSKS